MNKKIILGIIIIILVVIAVFNKTNQEKGPVRIGFAGPMSGELANYGENAKAAVEIAVEEINAAGGINGRNLEVVYEDDQCAGPAAASVANKLTTVDKVSAVVSPLCSGAALAAAPIYERAQVVQLSYCATSPLISDAGDFTFRAVPSDNFQAQKAANYLYEKVNKRKAAILFVNNDWGNGQANAFEKSFKEMGGQVVFKESFEQTSNDLRSSFTKIKYSDADVLFFPAFPDSSISGIKQLGESGLKITVFGADAWDTPDLWEKVSGAGDGFMFYAAQTIPTDSFKEKMKQKIGTDELVYCSSYAYDATKYLAQAMSEVGTNSFDIKDYLYNTTFKGTVSQPVLKFDKNGDPSDAVYSLKKVSGTKIVVVE